MVQTSGGVISNGNFKNSTFNLFAIDCIALTVIVLMQEGKSAGLGTIAGIADSYWGQNKGRSMEGALVKSTKFLAILFIVLAAVLNLKVFA